MSGHGTPRVASPLPAPTPSGAVPTPTNFVISPAQDYLTSQVLPGGGMFTGTIAQAVPLGTKRVTFWITYTRGAAGGYPTFRPFFTTPGGAVGGRNTVLDLSSFAAANPEGTTKFYLENLDGPAPVDGNPIQYQLTFLLPPATTGIDLLSAEKGDIANPGTIEIKYTGDG